MLTASLPIELALILVWIVGITLSTIKYLRARKQGQIFDQLIWFGVWCVFVTAASTVVMAGWDIVTRI